MREPFFDNAAVSLTDKGLFHLRIDTARPLSASLIDDLSGLCDRIEDIADRADNPVVTLHLSDRDSAVPNLSWPGEVGIRLVNKWEQILRRLERLAAVTIAVAEDRCGGPALEVLLSCDYRIGTSGLRLKPPVYNGGLWPGMIVHRLANQLGSTRARHLVLFGSDVSATQAIQLGLIDDAVDDPATAVATVAKSVAGLTGSELAIRRRLLLDATTTSFEEALGAHLAACDRALRRAQAS